MIIYGTINTERLKYNTLTGELWKETKRKNRHNKQWGYVLNNSFTGHGYYHISIAGKKVGSHRVIMQLLGYDVTGLQVRHLDGDVKNNRKDNLALGTASDNMRDPRNPRDPVLPPNVVKAGKRYRVELIIHGLRFRPYFNTVAECTDFIETMKGDL